MHKRYKQALTVALIGIAFILAVFTSVPAWIKVAVFALALLMVTINSKGERLYAKANKLINERNPEKLPEAVDLYMKALEKGIPDNFILVAATLILQHGDPEVGKKYLEMIISNPKKDIRCQAKISLSMYYWIRKDMDKAIELCEEVYDENFKNRNLYTNLATYYTDKGNQKKFEAILKEALQSGNLSLPIYDLEAVSSMMHENYKRAGEILTSLFAQAEPSFADPYIHMALVKLHYGNVRDAIEYLERAEKTLFSNTVLYQKEDIRKMRQGLEDPDTRLMYVSAMTRNLLSMINGRELVFDRMARPRCEELLLPGYPEEPVFSKENNLTDILRENIKKKDERDVNTDLTEEDEKWLERHRND